MIMGDPCLYHCSSKREGDQKCSRIRRVLRGVLQECVVAECPARLMSDLRDIGHRGS